MECLHVLHVNLACIYKLDLSRRNKERQGNIQMSINSISNASKNGYIILFACVFVKLADKEFKYTFNTCLSLMIQYLNSKVHELFIYHEKKDD